MILLVLFSFLFAGEPKDTSADSHEVVVYGNKNKVIYVAPTEISFDNNFDTNYIFSLSNSHKHFAKRKGEYGYYSFGDEIEIYDNETVEFLELNCDFKKQPLKCACQNDMWFLKSKIKKSKEEILISLILFDQDGRVISRSSVSNTKSITYNKRKRKGSSSSTAAGCNSPNCNSTGVSSSSSSYEEDLETEVIVANPSLLAKDLYQASIFLWSSIKINE